MEKLGFELMHLPEEAALFLVTVPLRVKPAAGTERMDMGMAGQVCPHVCMMLMKPGVPSIYVGSLESSVIVSDGMEEQRIQFLLVTVDQGVQLRQSVYLPSPQPSIPSFSNETAR